MPELGSVDAFELYNFIVLLYTRIKNYKKGVMNLLHKISFSVLAMSMISISVVSTAKAEMYQEQSQSASQKSSFSYSCDGSNCGGSAEMKTSSKVEQSQSQGTASFSNRGRMRSNNWDNDRGWKRNNYRDTSGEVTLDWDHRGGTCYVRYTGAGSKGYNYNTSTSCDNGSITIGGLQTGKNYRFQVKKDDGGWSQPMTAKAI